MRYPWFGGYASAPLAFAAGRKYADTGGFTLLSNITPLLTSGDKSAAAIAAQGRSAQALFTLHFVRRALEVVFVNDYTGTFARDSRLELLYYSESAGLDPILILVSLLAFLHSSP